MEPNQCPLLTDYATNEQIKSADRPFAAINKATLEKLFAIRNWEIDEKNPIPFHKPASVRDFIYDPHEKQLTDVPLRIKEFQKQAVIHLTRIPRFLLGDAVGLGKSCTSLVAFAWLKERNPQAKMLIITTKSTTFQWSDECEKYTTLRPRVMTDAYKGMKGSNARYAQLVDFLEKDEHDILIAKYDSLKGRRKLIKETGNKERESEETRTYREIIKAHREKLVLTLDESHRLKKPGTETRRFAQAVCRYPERVWALTATAIKNGLDEMYSIASAIGVSPLGNMQDFYRDYCLWREAPIGDGRTIQLLTGFKNVAYFKEQLRPFFLGRSQKQVKEKLPKLTTVYHSVELDDEQKKILTQVPLGLFELPPIVFQVAGETFTKDRDAENSMTQLSVQQLVSNHWALLDRNNPEVFLTKTLSPKEEVLRDMLEGDTMRGEKIIVFSKYRSWIDRLEWLTKNGHFTQRKFLRITGAENEKQRNENKRLFQSPDSGYDLIFINSAGMEGINLQQAAHLVLLDLCWSWGDLLQIVGRMIRISSPHSACSLHILLSKGTIDEYAVDTLKSKKGVFEAILGSSHSSGILDKGDVDLESGMEQAGTDDEFRKLLRAYSKKIGMNAYLSGKKIESSKRVQHKEGNSWLLG